MNFKKIETELAKWNDKDFLDIINTELNEYVNELDTILYERYYRKIESLGPGDRERAMSSLKARNLLDDDMNYVGEKNIVRLDSNTPVANGGFINGKIIVNPHSAEQFYAAYMDFSNGITEGIRQMDYGQPLDRLGNLSSLEVLYWYYFNERTYQDFLKSTMLHEDIHKWTLSADIFDDPQDLFATEGLVETEAREVAKEYNLEYANCFRNDEVMFIDYLSRYNNLDRTSIMLCCNSEEYLIGSICMVIRKEIEGIEPEELRDLTLKIYGDLSEATRSNNKSSIGINYREIFAKIKPDKSYKIIESIENAIVEEKKNRFFESKFDEKSITYLDNFVKEFTQLFGKYISEDEIIRTIQANLENIQFQETILGKQGSYYYGEYNRETKTIELYSGLSEEELKSVFFHEMLHCIFDTPERSSILGIGFDEGLTQYLTEIRDDEYRNGNKTEVAYPTLTYLVQKVAQVLGEEEFLKLAFDVPSKFLEEIGKYTDEPENFFYNLDDIWADEDKFRNGTETLFDDFFGAIKSPEEYELEDDEWLRMSQESLVSIYISMVKNKVRVSNRFDFEEACMLVELFADRLGVDAVSEEDFTKLMELGAKAKLSKEEIEGIITENNIRHTEDKMTKVYDELPTVDTQKLGKESILTLETLYIDQTSKEIEEHYKGKDPTQNQYPQEL